jgi:hypothetical protein
MIMKNLRFLILFPVIFITIFVLGCANETPKPKVETEAIQKPTVNNDELIANIKKFREDGEDKLVKNKLTRKVIEFTGKEINDNIKQKWEKMDAYYDGDKLIRIQLYPHKNISQRTEEFYLMNDKLIFAFIQDKGPKHEGKDKGESGKEFYFNNDLLIKFEDRSGDKESNTEQEKKMYESKLPFEVSELLEIIKASK